MNKHVFTNDQLQKHVKSGSTYENPYLAGMDKKYSVHRGPAPMICCADDFSVSVQASATHYCKPRDNDGPYTLFELGFPNAEDELIQPYAESPAEPTQTVYPQVPLDVVLALINKHGGLAA